MNLNSFSNSHITESMFPVVGDVRWQSNCMWDST